MEKGDTLTIDNDIIDISGNILFSKGQKVIIREVWKDEARWSNVYDMWMPAKIHGFKLKDHYGLWLTNCFVETKNLK